MIGKSVLSILQEKREKGLSNFIPFGANSLDECFGGIPIQGITEISGEAGSGKTQICLSIALESIINRKAKQINGYAAILSCGEGLFPIKRLSQLAQAIEVSEGIPAQKLLTNVDIQHCNNTDDAVDTLFKYFPDMCRKKPIKILIIDSLAGLIRHEYDMRQESEILDRAQFLFSIAAQLKWISDTFHTAVVVVNQVTADFNASTSAGTTANTSVPALGLAWCTCVNTRFFVQRSSAMHSHVESSTDGTAESNRTDNSTNHSYPVASSSFTASYVQDDRISNTEKENSFQVRSVINSNHSKRKLSDAFPDAPTGLRERVISTSELSSLAGTKSQNQNTRRQIRTLKLLFSSYLPYKEVNFEITSKGLV